MHAAVRGIHAAPGVFAIDGLPKGPKIIYHYSLAVFEHSSNLFHDLEVPRPVA